MAGDYSIPSIREFLDKLPRHPCDTKLPSNYCTICHRLNRTVADRCDRGEKYTPRPKKETAPESGIDTKGKTFTTVEEMDAAKDEGDFIDVEGDGQYDDDEIIIEFIPAYQPKKEEQTTSDTEMSGVKVEMAQMVAAPKETVTFKPAAQAKDAVTFKPAAQPKAEVTFKPKQKEETVSFKPKAKDENVTFKPKPAKEEQAVFKPKAKDESVSFKPKAKDEGVTFKPKPVETKPAEDSMFKPVAAVEAEEESKKKLKPKPAPIKMKLTPTKKDGEADDETASEEKAKPKPKMKMKMKMKPKAKSTSKEAKDEAEKDDAKPTKATSAGTFECPECGNMVTEEAKSCNDCGAIFEDEQES